MTICKPRVQFSARPASRGHSQLEAGSGVQRLRTGCGAVARAGAGANCMQGLSLVRVSRSNQRSPRASIGSAPRAQAGGAGWSGRGGDAEGHHHQRRVRLPHCLVVGSEARAHPGAGSSLSLGQQ
jgi:hypothetical protein